MISFQLNLATLCKRFSLLLLLLPVIIVWRCYLLFSIWLTQGGVYGVLMKPGATFRTDDAKKLTRCGFAHLHIACYVSALVLIKVTTLNKLKVTKFKTMWKSFQQTFALLTVRKINLLTLKKAGLVKLSEGQKCKSPLENFTWSQLYFKKYHNKVKNLNRFNLSSFQINH